MAKNKPLPSSLTTTLMVKLASIIVHIEEASSPGGHEIDLETVKSLANDAEVKAWIAAIPKVLLPLKRSNR